jgi:RimJ/RimL family protein N-acetyltransferase
MILKNKRDKKNYIESHRLLLKPFTHENITNRYIGWLNDPLVVRYSEQRHFKHSYDSCKNYLDSLYASGHKIWMILCKDRDIHIGNITAHLDKYNSIADIGILIGEREYWGKGYGFEAWSTVCSFAFNTLRVRKITAGTLEKNKAMVKIMKKAGMSEDGRRIKHYLFEGQVVDVIHMAIFNNRWE